MATSTAQNDAGVFEFSFQDARYAMGEGEGAVNSTWTLTFPKSFPRFDYQTISDVIIHIAYTAFQDEHLRTEVEKLIGAAEGAIVRVLETTPLARAFSFRHEFSGVFNRLVSSPLGTSVPLELMPSHLPFFLRGRTPNVQRALLAVRPREGEAIGDLAISIEGAPFTGFSEEEELGGLAAVDVETTFAPDLFGSYEIAITDSGALGPDPPGSEDDAAIGQEELLDLLLYIEYTVEAP